MPPVKAPTKRMLVSFVRSWLFDVITPMSAE